MIKPEFWDDEVLAQSTSRDTRLTFIGMWTHADDYGVVKGNAVWLKSKIFPYDEIKPETFMKWLTELEKGKWITPFVEAGAKYYYIHAFTKHQTINRPSQVKNPTPPDTLTEDSLSTHDILTDETETEVKPKPKPKDKGEVPKIPPQISEVISYCKDRHNGIDPHKWFDHYEARGWMIGHNRMKDWKAAIRTWEKNDFGDRKVTSVDDNLAELDRLMKGEK